jgi:hypothetical protein
MRSKLCDRAVRLACFVLICAVLALLNSCAHQPRTEGDDLPGFWSGLLHGFLMLFSFIGGLFTDTRIYAFPNSGGWYDFGYLIGAFNVSRRRWCQFKMIGCHSTDPSHDRIQPSSSTATLFAMIQPMNHRVGFQRLYAVLAVVWIGFVFFAMPADRLKFWTASPPDDWVNVDPSDVMPKSAKFTPPPLSSIEPEVAAQPSGKDLSKYGTVSPARQEQKTTRPAGAINYGAHTAVSPARQGQKTTRPLTDADIDIFDKIDAEAKNLSIVKSEPLPAPPSRWRKVLWLAGVLFLPPAVGYFLLFHVVRWVYRGFKSAPSLKPAP